MSQTTMKPPTASSAAKSHNGKSSWPASEPLPIRLEGGALPDILLVEDNPGDVELTRTAFEDAHVLNRLVVARDGEQALAILRREGPHADRPLPGLILLDLNLPRVDGREVLSLVKHDPQLAQIPVVVLTSSRSERDIAEAYELGANAFVSKPVDMDDFFRVVRSIGTFWFSVVSLPVETKKP